MSRNPLPVAVVVYWGIFASLVIGGAVFAQSLEMDSDGFEDGILFVIGLPVLIVIGVMGKAAMSRDIRRGVLKGWPRWAPWGCFAGLFLLAWASFAVLHRWRIPPNIDFDFDYGASDSWQIVNFHFKEGGRWLEGPRIQGYPMIISFPDLNGDGHPDIKAEQFGDRGQVVEYIYLPKNDGKCFWHLVNNTSGLDAYYDPEDWPKYRSQP